HLRHAIRSGDYRFESQALLHDVVVPLTRGDRVDVSFCGSELNASASEGIQRLQQVVIVVLRNAGVLVEEPRLWHATMVQVRNGKLADTEIPVGMPGPLDVKFL